MVDPELQWLMAQGYRIWWDQGVSPGLRWSDELGQRIVKSSLFLFLVTPRSVDSPHCQDEVYFALDHQIPVITVHLVETMLPVGLQLRLGSKQAVMKWALSDANYRQMLSQSLEPVQSSPSPPKEKRAESSRYDAFERSRQLVELGSISIEVSAPATLQLEAADWEFSLSSALVEQGVKVLADSDANPHYYLRCRVSRERDQYRISIDLLRRDGANQIWSTRITIPTIDDDRSTEWLSRVVATKSRLDIHRRCADEWPEFRSIKNEAKALFFNAVDQINRINLGEHGDWNAVESLLRSAILADETFAAAHERLANIYAGGFLTGSIDETADQALTAIERAIELNGEPTLQNLIQLGHVHRLLRCDYVQAHDAYTRALDDPFGVMFYPVHLSLADLALREGRTSEVPVHLRRASVLQGHSEHGFLLNEIAYCFNVVGDYEQGLKFSGMSLKLATAGISRLRALLDHARTLSLLGRPEEGRSLVEEAWDLEGRASTRGFADAFVAVGLEDRAREIFEGFYSKGPEDYLAFGDVDGAVDCALRRIRSRNDVRLMNGLRIAPWWETLRASPRWPEILAIFDEKETRID